jgi:hypothetical protein
MATLATTTVVGRITPLRSTITIKPMTTAKMIAIQGERRFSI